METSGYLGQLVHLVYLMVTTKIAEVKIQKSRTANERWVRLLAAPPAQPLQPSSGMNVVVLLHSIKYGETSYGSFVMGDSQKYYI
jgi:hypothetical protein